MKVTLFAITAFAALVAAQTCTIDSCTENCQAYDDILASCANTTSYDNPTTCYCEAGYGLDTDTAILNLCVACNQAGLGLTELDVYQSLTVACDNYDTYGEAAAVSVLALELTDVIDTYSSTYLPIIQSELCSGNILSTSSVAYSTPTGAVGSVAASKVSSAGSLPASTSVAGAATLIPGVLSSHATTATGTATTAAATANTQTASKAAAQRNWHADIAMLAVPVLGAIL